MSNTDNLALGSLLLSWLVALAGVLWLAQGFDGETGFWDEGLDRYGQDVPPCPDGQHSWSVCCSGYELGDYYYRCDHCGWVALPSEVELDRW